MVWNRLFLFACLPALLLVLSAVAAPAQDSDGGSDVDADAAGADAGEAGGAGAAGDDADAPREDNQYWVINLELKGLKMIAPRRGAGAGRVYWYMVYTLNNPYKEDRSIYVSMAAASDRKKTYSSLYLPTVEAEIEGREGRPLWGKSDEQAEQSAKDSKDADYNYSTLKAGETRYCVAIFNALDLNANHITIEVKGLSNQVDLVTRGDGSKALESRVREFVFERPGDEYAVTLDSFTLVSKRWVRKQLALSGDAASADQR